MSAKGLARAVIRRNKHGDIVYRIKDNGADERVTAIAREIEKVIEEMTYHAPQEYAGTATQPLAIINDLGASHSINEGQQWSVTATASGGVAPYSFLWQRSLTDEPESQNSVEWSDIGASFITTTATTATFTSGGAVGNDRWYRCIVTDSEGISSTSVVLDLLVNSTGGGDEGEEPVEPPTTLQPSLSADITLSSTGSGANGELIAGDVINIDYVVINAGDVDLTGINVTASAPVNVSGGTNLSIPVGAASVLSESYTVTQADEDNRLISISMTVDSAETSAVSRQITQSVGESDFSDMRWGFWVEPRNLRSGWSDSSDGSGTQGIDYFNWAHVKVRWIPGNPDYAPDVINAARSLGKRVRIQLGNVTDWTTGYNAAHMNVGRLTGVFSETGFYQMIDNHFSQTGNNAVWTAIRDGLLDGTVSGIHVADEPHHKRWSPTYNVQRGETTAGNQTHFSNQELDNLAGYIKNNWSGVPIPLLSQRSGANMIIAYGRGSHVFQHLTHSELTVSAKKHSARGFEHFMSNVSAPAYASTGLAPNLMFQFGFKSNQDPWTGANVTSGNTGAYWWDDGAGGSKYTWADGTNRYQVDMGNSGYIKQSPLEADWMRCALFTKRDPVTWALDPNGVVLFDTFSIFRGDRNTENVWTLPWYQDMLNHWKVAVPANDLTPMRENTPVIEP